VVLLIPSMQMPKQYIKFGQDYSFHTTVASRTANKFLLDIIIINFIINLHLPTSSLTLYQNGAYFTGIKIFIKLPSELKELVESPKIFKRTLRRYLVSHCFYKLEEFYCMNC
jgi:hypothetical protein